MIYVSNVIFNQHYFSIQAITAALNGIPHVYVELLPLAQVQRMGSGSDSIWGQKNCWNLFVACQIYFQFSTVAVQIQPAGKTNCWNLFVACQIYFQFSTVAVQIQPAGKTNCWNLFVACQIFSIFHSSSTDSTCRQNKLVEPVCCMSNIFNFPQ